MSNKPLIGMNADYRAAARSMPAYSYIAAGYFQSITAAGGIPVVLPPMDDPDAISQVLDQLNGFVMIGGADLDPRNDGFMLHPSVRPLDPVRETSDRLLMADIAERRMPVLGIGTGMQLLNVQQGGNLFLHIKEDLPNAVPHHDPQAISAIRKRISGVNWCRAPRRNLDKPSNRGPSGTALFPTEAAAGASGIDEWYFRATRLARGHGSQWAEYSQWKPCNRSRQL